MNDESFLERHFGFLWTLLAGCVTLSQFAVYYDPRRFYERTDLMPPYWEMQFLIAGLGTTCAVVLVDRIYEREGKYIFPATGIILALAQWGINLGIVFPWKIA